LTRLIRALFPRRDRPRPARTADPAAPDSDRWRAPAALAYDL